MNVLVIAAHPDDEVLGCGATMARLASRGHNVSIAILGEGETSRYDGQEMADKAALEELRSKAHKAGALMCASEVNLFGLPDNRFDTLPLLDVVKIIERLIERIQPQWVFTQHGGDLNIDHEVTYRATLTATRPLQGSGGSTVYAYEVPSSSEWAFGSFSPLFRPQVFFDVSNTIEVKVAAMQCYESEARPFPHPRSPEALRALAAWRGSTAGLMAAEAFELVREVNPL